MLSALQSCMLTHTSTICVGHGSASYSSARFVRTSKAWHTISRTASLSSLASSSILATSQRSASSLSRAPSSSSAILTTLATHTSSLWSSLRLQTSQISCFQRITRLHGTPSTSWFSLPLECSFSWTYCSPSYSTITSVVLAGPVRQGAESAWSISTSSLTSMTKVTKVGSPSTKPKLSLITFSISTTATRKTVRSSWQFYD